MTTLVFLIFPALIIAAAICDVRSFLIPNRLTAALAAAWPFAVVLSGMPLEAAAMTMGLAFAILIISVGFFAAGWLGGGDAKLITVAVLWVGLANVGVFLMVTVMAGAVLALGLLMFRRYPLPVAAVQVDWVVQLHERKRDIPYGVAIAVGALQVWPSTAFFPF